MPRALASTPTLPAIFVTALADRAAALGADRAPLLVASGAPPDLLRAPETPIPVAHVFATWAAVMRALDDPALPITFARGFQLEHYPVLGFATMTAPTGRDAISLVIRFGALITTSGRWTLSESDADGSVRLTWHRDEPRALGVRTANESAVAEMLHGIRQVMGCAEVRALSASFRHPAPRDTRAHDAHFGVRVRWGAGADAFSLPRAMLDAVPRLSSPALAAHFEAEARARMAEARAGETIRERVARVIGDDLAGEPSIVAAAKRLGTSERTLRRALASDGISFRALVDEVRRAHAEALLAGGRASLAEVAFSLGFSELSAFSRAFKRWTGQSPNEARRALR